MLGIYEKDIKSESIRNKILEDIKKVPKFNEKRNDNNFIAHVMNLIETDVKKKHCLDKMSLLCDIYADLFKAEFTTVERAKLLQNAQFIFDSKIIKKYSLYNRMINWMRNRFL